MPIIIKQYFRALILTAVYVQFPAGDTGTLWCSIWSRVYVQFQSSAVHYCHRFCSHLYYQYSFYHLYSSCYVYK